MSDIELSISVVSSNRFLSKAVRRVRPRFEEIISLVINRKQINPISLEFILLISDEPGEKEIDQGDGVFILQVGIDKKLSLRPDDDDLFFLYIASMLRLLIEKCPLSTVDREEVLTMFDTWLEGREVKKLDSNPIRLKKY